MRGFFFCFSTFSLYLGLFGAQRVFVKPPEAKAASDCEHVIWCPVGILRHLLRSVKGFKDRWKNVGHCCIKKGNELCSRHLNTFSDVAVDLMLHLSFHYIVDFWCQIYVYIHSVVKEKYSKGKFNSRAQHTLSKWDIWMSECLYVCVCVCREYSYNFCCHFQTVIERDPWQGPDQDEGGLQTANSLKCHSSPILTIRPLLLISSIGVIAYKTLCIVHYF